MFGNFGAVTEVKIIKDRFTGEPRGFGFVRMVSDEEAKAAIRALNNKKIDGKTLIVSVAKAQNRSAKKRF